VIRLGPTIIHKIGSLIIGWGSLSMV